ncbi:hypothetical protein AYI70_g7995 [Smittium culicis]|nr:hypothetical protein AYI70_g7995 [Smittium culicis]
MCLKYAISQSNMFTIRFKNVPPVLWEPLSVTLAIPATVIIMSNLYSDPLNPTANKKLKTSYNALLSVFTTLSVYNESPKILFFAMTAYSKKLSNTYKLNLKDNNFKKVMKQFSIHDKDYHPWLVPKHLSYFKYTCCGKDGLSDIDYRSYANALDNPAENSLPNSMFAYIHTSNTNNPVFTHSQIINYQRNVIRPLNPPGIIKRKLFQLDHEKDSKFGNLLEKIAKPPQTSKN